jgi:hypothetical protein
MSRYAFPRGVAHVEGVVIVADGSLRSDGGADDAGQTGAGFDAVAGDHEDHRHHLVGLLLRLLSGEPPGTGHKLSVHDLLGNVGHLAQIQTLCHHQRDTVFDQSRKSWQAVAAIENRLQECEFGIDPSLEVITECVGNLVLNIGRGRDVVSAEIEGQADSVVETVLGDAVEGAVRGKDFAFEGWVEEVSNTPRAKLAKWLFLNARTHVPDPRRPDSDAEFEDAEHVLDPGVICLLGWRERVLELAHVILHLVHRGFEGVVDCFAHDVDGDEGV